MYTYNVTIKIDEHIHDEWLHWMKSEHMAEVLATGMFQSYSFHQLLEPNDENDNSFTFVTQYHTDSLEKYYRYIAEFAPILRDKGFEKFGDKFVAFRSLLQQIKA